MTSGSLSEETLSFFPKALKTSGYDIELRNELTGTVADSQIDVLDYNYISSLFDFQVCNHSFKAPSSIAVRS